MKWFNNKPIELILISKTSMKNNLTKKQGQYLAFIYYYRKLNKQSPAFKDFEKHFKSDPASVNGMIKKLVEKGFIKKEKGKSRSIELLIRKDDIPELE